MLLSNPDAAAFIDRNFVPVWESVRPVPKVTIDFGDGRVLKRTLKGNTVMYVLLPDGRIVDALPGVYTPQAFQAEAQRSLQAAQALMASHDDRATRQWHQAQVKDALLAENRSVSMSKAVVEAPLLQAIGALPPEDASPATFRTPFDRLCARLDDISRRPMRADRMRVKIPVSGTTAADRGRDAVTLDSKINVTYVRPAVHLLLASYDHLPTPAECRNVVFKQLLHVPIDDPNLGLGDVVTPGTMP